MQAPILLSIVLPALLLAGCATHPDPQLSRADGLVPTEAIVRAADAAPYPVHGTFVMPVRAIGAELGMTYLNSEKDYRDQRNLTVAMTPTVARALEARLDGPLSKALLGHNIVVRGDARRVKIDFISNGRKTDKYYYQTHVLVTVADQIQLAGTKN